MGKDSNNRYPDVLILADFADGSWHATSFAMQFLYQKESPFSILLTYRKPDFGHFMTRNITPRLKEITHYELRKLKDKLLSNYLIKPENIKTLSIEGDLNKILHYNPKIDSFYNVVLSTYSSFEDSNTVRNRYVKKLINTAKFPFFIVPGNPKDLYNTKHVLVGNQNKTPSPHLINQTLKICTETNSELEILFVKNSDSSVINKEILDKYNEYFKNIKFRITQKINSSKFKGIEKYLKEVDSKLVIVDM